MIKISELEKVFEELFEEEEGKVSSVETVYELSKNEDFYKLVISLQNLMTENTILIHTKFIFRCDLNKREILENSFLYLYTLTAYKLFENIDIAIISPLLDNAFTSLIPVKFINPIFLKL